jgi:CheY-like chemotaxis protein
MGSRVVSSGSWKAGSAARRPTVLIVDDDPVVLEVISAVLESVGYVVQVRDSALGTTAVIFHNQPDIVLLDIEMPALNGLRIARLLREKKLKTAVILHSGRPAHELLLLAREAGAAGAIAKSHDTDQFLTQFRRIARSLGF